MPNRSILLTQNIATKPLHHKMGLLSGRKNDAGTGVTDPHRYETCSRGGLFSNNSAPGTATGSGTTNTVGRTGTGGGLFGKRNRKVAPATTTGTRPETRTTGTGVGGTDVGRAGVGGAGVPAAPGNQIAPDAGTPSQYSEIHVVNTCLLAPSAGHANTAITKGKIQAGIGQVVGSANLKAKGIAKMEQGEQEKAAAGHLADADRLESAAADKRSMAGVTHEGQSGAGNARLRH
jgi:hypothetical protein